jgi:hypothetical protein
MPKSLFGPQTQENVKYITQTQILPARRRGARPAGEEWTPGCPGHCWQLDGAFRLQISKKRLQVLLHRKWFEMYGSSLRKGANTHKVMCHARAGVYKSNPQVDASATARDLESGDEGLGRYEFSRALARWLSTSSSCQFLHHRRHHQHQQGQIRPGFVPSTMAQIKLALWRSVGRSSV